MTIPHICVSGLGKIYTGSGGAPIAALQDINFEIRDSERVGIIGANGAGKSTLLQILAGVATATSGSVAITGKVHAILTVGMGLRDEATGRENLFLDGALLGKTHSEIAAHLDEMIAFAELGGFIDQPVRTYSSGMKARLSFASLTHIDPEILIIDEALSVGDAFFAAKATRMIENLCARGRIVLIVSHSIGSIKEMCQRCIWLENGRLQADGLSAEVGDAYAATTRAREEAEIARKFGASGRAWSADPNSTLSDARLIRARDGAEAVLVEAGEIAAIEVTLSLRSVLTSAALRVWIESNDGLALADELVQLHPDDVEPGTRTLRISMGELDWRPSLYQTHIELQEAGKPIAHVAASFKVFSDANILGGNPLIRTPPSVRMKAK